MAFATHAIVQQHQRIRAPRQPVSGRAIPRQLIPGQTPVEIARRAMDTGRREVFDIVILDTAGRLAIEGRGAIRCPRSLGGSSVKQNRLSRPWQGLFSGFSQSRGYRLNLRIGASFSLKAPTMERIFRTRSRDLRGVFCARPNTETPEAQVELPGISARYERLAVVRAAVVDGDGDGAR
jgi:hypothetical protein